MGALKLLIADSNEDFQLALAEALQPFYQVRCCRSGSEALEALRGDDYDILILDLILPELDGITLLERVVEAGIYPKVLVITGLLNEYIFESADRLGIGYIIRKPCDIPSAVLRVRDLSRPLNPPKTVTDPRNFIRDRLHAFSFSPKHHGYAYLLEAVIRMAEDPSQTVTKHLYPAVAAACGCKSDHVERSIRNAIEIAWKHREETVWQTSFPETNRRPTNTVFITRLAEDLRRKMNTK